MLKAKEYHIYRQKYLYGKMRFNLTGKIKIECVGGDSMIEEKELVFLNPEDVPRLSKGATGRNWTELFDKIPKQKVLPMTKEEYGSPANIRAEVAKYNILKNGKVLKAMGRTDKETGEVILYVQRV